jgi:hypothetical protein
MKITELLKMLDKRDGHCHFIRVHSDGSGSIKYKNIGDPVINWGTKESMNMQLTKLCDELNNTTITWEL